MSPEKASKGVSPSVQGTQSGVLNLDAVVQEVLSSGAGLAVGARQDSEGTQCAWHVSGLHA